MVTILLKGKYRQLWKTAHLSILTCKVVWNHWKKREMCKKCVFCCFMNNSAQIQGFKLLLKNKMVDMIQESL